MIRNIVFDVGGVLVRLRYQPFVRYLQDAGVDMSDLPAWLSTVDLEAHERGEITGEVLLAHRRDGAAAARPGRTRARWLEMFERRDEMFTLATGLMDGYRVYLLSNVGDLHWAHLDANYGVDSLVHGAVASFRVGAIKPTRRDLSQGRSDVRSRAGGDGVHRRPAAERRRRARMRLARDPPRGPAGTRREFRALGVRIPPPFPEE